MTQHGNGQGIVLDRGHAPGSRIQQGHHRPIPWAQLEHMFTKFNVGDRPPHEVFESRSPVCRSAIEVVEAVHCARPASCSRYKHVFRIRLYATLLKDNPMRLTKVSDYSLRVLIYLAVHPNRPVSIGEMSRAYGVSSHVL